MVHIETGLSRQSERQKKWKLDLSDRSFALNAGVGKLVLPRAVLQPDECLEPEVRTLAFGQRLKSDIQISLGNHLLLAVYA